MGPLPIPRVWGTRTWHLHSCGIAICSNYTGLRIQNFTLQISHRTAQPCTLNPGSTTPFKIQHQRWPTSDVARAGGMQQLLYGAWYGWQWSREGLPHRVRHLVLDEADLLLSGGFLDQTQRLLEVCMQSKSPGSWIRVYSLKPRPGYNFRDLDPQ